MFGHDKDWPGRYFPLRVETLRKGNQLAPGMA